MQTMGTSKLIEETHPAIVSIRKRVSLKSNSPRIIRTLRSIFITIILVIAGITMNLIQLLVAPLSFFLPSLAYRITSTMAVIIWEINQYLVEGVYKANLTLSGLKGIPREESAFVLSNHVFFGDYLLLNALAKRLGMLGYIRYFLKDSIKYIPVFGWALYLGNMLFLKRDWLRDSNRIFKMLGVFINYELPVWIISYVEGTRFCEPKSIASQQYSRDNNLPILNYVLLPRCKGFVSTLTALRDSHVKNLYDVTVAYHHRVRGFGVPPSLFEIVTGNLDDYQFHVHIDRIPISDVPMDEPGMTKWLYTLFVKKDRILEAIKSAFESKIKST